MSQENEISNMSFISFIKMYNGRCSKILKAYSSDDFCCLLITFAISLDPDQ